MKKKKIKASAIRKKTYKPNETDKVIAHAIYHFLSKRTNPEKVALAFVAGYFASNIVNNGRIL